MASLVCVAVLFVVFLARKSFADSAAWSGGKKTTDAEGNRSEQTATAGVRVSAGALQDMPLALAIMEAEQAIAAGADARSVLAELKAKLLAADPKAASVAICAYLASGRDVSTGMPFSVGPNGQILSASSMRCFLLDLLLTVDPQAALAEAEVVFDAKTSADEYAVCLRNVGKIDTSSEGRAYVAQRARELLNDAALASHVTAGFVESFDAIVYGGNTDDFKLLAGYTDKDKGLALNMPAFMALDRMVIDNPVLAMQEFLDDATLLDERPQTRAGFFARADLSDPDQLAEVTQYVQGLNPSSVEAEYYFSLFPNANFTITDGILTTQLAVSPEYVRVRFESALTTVEVWLSDKSFSRYKSELEAAKTRLEAQLGR